MRGFVATAFLLLWSTFSRYLKVNKPIFSIQRMRFYANRGSYS
jgi:hypothetical protein